MIRRATSFQPTTRAGIFLAAICSLFFAATGAATQEAFRLEGHGGPVKGIGTTPDGTILTASFDNSVGLWTKAGPRWFDGHEAAVNAVVQVGDGMIVSGGDDFTLRIWDPETGQGRVLGRHDAKIIRLAVSPDGRRVASASWDRTVTIWPLDGSQPVVLRGHANTVSDVAFSPDGARVYTVSADGTVRLWDADTGAFTRRLVQHGFGINTVLVAPDESWLAYGAVDGGTRVISLPDGGESGDFTADRRPILAMAYNSAVNRIAVGDAQGYIMMIDTAEWRISDDFRATASGPVWALAFSPDGRNIHAGGISDALHSWPVASLDTAEQMAGTERSFLKDPDLMSNGERQFQRKCSVCHTLEPDSKRRAGPTLFGLFGRPAGAVTDYFYSDTLISADIVWSEETIDLLFDLGPDHYIPGSKMPMQRITDAQDRADLIAFLREVTAPE
ncbi:c-type cytochrome [uncultured Roseobacter sp.]|uniref:c-type cytochrome n=1 Tax=uncultured Roseobacter sp. TaxID=114847 RepID=UPI0026255CE8|nr:c-type cytochrome [uncultured Roseobacter sp.]